MQASNAVQTPQHQTSPTPAAKPVRDSMPDSPTQQSAALTSRPVLPSLLVRALDPRDPDVIELPAETTNPRLKPSSPNKLEDRKPKGNDGMVPSEGSSGIKRARDGKDGPDGKHPKADHQHPEKRREKPGATDREPLDQHDTESAQAQPNKRARKGSASAKSATASRAKPANDGPGQAEARSPRLKTISITTASNHNTVTETETASSTTWKHGAQSPRKQSAQRGSVTLSPRRSSNASTLEPGSPARQTDTLPPDKAASGNTPSFTPDTPDKPNDDFTFSACDLDQEGVIHVVSSSSSPETDRQAAPVAPPPKGTLSTSDNGNAVPGRQAVAAQPGLSTEMTALLADLDDMLGNEIKM